MNHQLIIAASLTMVLPLTAPAIAQTPPVADAGPSRYAAEDPVRLDGTGSYDPDGRSITQWDWFQISGPEIGIAGADTAKPLISGFVQVDGFQTVEIGLVVGDDSLMSAEDTVEITIVPRSKNESMELINPPFRHHLPTLITFGDGQCYSGAAWHLDEAWRERFNVITGHYDYPHIGYAYQVVVLLSKLAPAYDQPIQAIGFRSGGLPISVVASVLNYTIRDPRFAVNRMTLLDAYCYPDEIWSYKISAFNASPVAGEPAWVEFYKTKYGPITGALNVALLGFSYSQLLNWYLESINEEFWPDGDMYNGGVTAGYPVSVGGPARNLRLATEGENYYFRCRKMGPGCLDQLNAARFPGRLPEPARLIGPEDGAVAGPQGAVLSCHESQHATNYELLLGADPAEMTVSVSQTARPPGHAISEFPFSPTYWTVRVRDAYGTTISAEPRAVYPSAVDPFRSGGQRVTPDP